MSEPKPRGKPAADSREAKLAKALRDNLRRRKASGGAGSPSDPSKPPPPGEG